MKKCRACGTEYIDNKNSCPNCGNTSCLTICENCRAAFDTGYCPNCGVQKGDKGKVCPLCGKKYFSAACPDCGYAPRKRSDTVGYSERPKKKVTAGIVLLWIFFLPIMATIAIWKKKEWRLSLKIILIAVIWGLCILFAVVNKSDTETSAFRIPIDQEAVSYHECKM